MSILSPTPHLANDRYAAPTLVTPVRRGSRSAPVEHYAHVVAMLRQSRPRGAELLHDSFVSEVKRVVWRLLGPDADHEDIVQQVFLNALTTCHHVREPDRLQAWVRAVTVHTVLRELRRRSVSRSLKREVTPSGHRDPSRDVELRDRLLTIKRIVERMPPQERAVFILHRLERYTVTELAKVFGWSTGTTKRRIAAAHARFRRLGGPDTALLPLRQ